MRAVPPVALRGAPVAAAALSAVAGCYAPSVPAGLPCADTGACPVGQRCELGVCVATGGEPPPDGGLRIVIGAGRDELRDVQLSEGDPDTNYGALDHVSIDVDEVSLLRFDLTAVPPGARIAAATLLVRTTEEASEDGGTVTVHRMREAWAEGEATWNLRRAGAPWAAAGARPPSRDAAPLAELRPQRQFAAIECELPVRLVEEWRADPAGNHGIVIARGTSTQHVHLRARETEAWSTLTLDVLPP